MFAGTKDGESYGFYLESEGLTDFTELTNDEYGALLDGQAYGKVIKFHKGAKPTLENPPEPTEAEKAARRIRRLKEYLSDTDYVVIKIAEGIATAAEYADVIVRRKEAREEINGLEKVASSNL